ncbi:MAG: hypothetical protein QGH65_18465 [SAR324 cluster bacterium]|nr:hypothetical protein [SAR324 cluster bacterium]
MRKIDGFNRLPLETKRGLIWDWVPMHNVEHQLSGMEEPFFIGFTGKLVSSVHPVSEAECAKVHAAAVRVPAEGGIRCDDPSASRMFEAVGCTLESGGTLVKIPERVIMDASHSVRNPSPYMGATIPPLIALSVPARSTSAPCLAAVYIRKGQTSTMV